MASFAKILSPRHLKSFKPLFSHSAHYSLSKSRTPYVFTKLTLLRCSKAPTGGKNSINWRQISDKFSEKGRGDEKNYFLKVGRDQFLKIKERKIKEIKADIRALELEVREMDGKNSLQAEIVRQNLMVEIKELKAMLEKFKKSL